MSQIEEPTLLKQRRSRRQVLASLGLGAAALYVAPTLLSMDQAQAHDHHSRPGHSKASYSRPSHSRPRHSRPNHSRPRYANSHDNRRHGSSRGYESRAYRSRPDELSRFERDGVIELRISRVLKHLW
ncbi:hypothetical protein [Vreelandella profundi]|uniref:hypothetical protein n=1 Tax=Vreelandella profundi TaxID=2852117 RepID=UPI001EF0ABA4|nr:hypothetical protein [Halomonas profundi]